MSEAVPVNLLTFASSNWTEAPRRYRSQLDEIQKRFHLFGKTFIYSEKDLGNDYNARFSKYFSDHGFAYWSWKPIAILRALSEIPSGEMLFYIDGGCSFPMDRVDRFAADFSESCRAFYSSGDFLGLTYFLERPWPQFPGFPNATIVKREILEAFGLQEDLEFLFRYPHWQATMLLLRNDAKTVGFMKDWYLFFLENYETVIRSGFQDKTGQCGMFIHNGGDQAILQCMLYSRGEKIYNMNFMQDYNVIQHLRK